MNNPFTFETEKMVSNFTNKNYAEFEWNQTFIFPLCDHFFPIKIALISIVNDGWIMDHITEEILGSKEIYATDFMHMF